MKVERVEFVEETKSAGEGEDGKMGEVGVMVQEEVGAMVQEEVGVMVKEEVGATVKERKEVAGEAKPHMGTTTGRSAAIKGTDTE